MNSGLFPANPIRIFRRSPKMNDMERHVRVKACGT